MDAIRAAVGSGDGDVDELFCERVQGSGSDHDLFHALPGSLKQSRLICKSTPEVVDEVGLSYGSDIGKDCAYARVSGNVLVCPKLYGRQSSAPRSIDAVLSVSAKRNG